MIEHLKKKVYKHEKVTQRSKTEERVCVKKEKYQERRARKI